MWTHPPILPPWYLRILYPFTNTTPTIRESNNDKIYDDHYDTDERNPWLDTKYCTDEDYYDFTPTDEYDDWGPYVEVYASNDVASAILQEHQTIEKKEENEPHCAYTCSRKLNEAL